MQYSPLCGEDALCHSRIHLSCIGVGHALGNYAASCFSTEKQAKTGVGRHSRGNIPAELPSWVLAVRFAKVLYSLLYHWLCSHSQKLHWACQLFLLAPSARTETPGSRISLYACHLFCRLWESSRLAVHSKNSKIHIFHYVFGCFFYILSPLTIFWGHIACSNILNRSIQSNDFRRMLGMLCFLWCNYAQHRCHAILAGLRNQKNVADRARQKYFIPHGFLFEWISSPHYLLEILIYFSLVVESFPKAAYRGLQ